MVQGSRWSDTLRMAPCTLLAETDCRADEEHSDEHPDYRKVNPNVCEAGATKHHRLQTIDAIREREALREHLKPSRGSCQVEDSAKQDLGNNEKEHELNHLEWGIGEP